MRSKKIVHKIAYDKVRIDYYYSSSNNTQTLTLTPSHRRYGLPPSVGSTISLTEEEELDVYRTITIGGILMHMIENLGICLRIDM